MARVKTRYDKFYELMKLASIESYSKTTTGGFQAILIALQQAARDNNKHKQYINIFDDLYRAIGRYTLAKELEYKKMAGLSSKRRRR